MADKKKKKKKHPYYGSVFAPIFPRHSTTPKTTPDKGDGDNDADDVPSSGSAGGSTTGAAVAGGGGSAGSVGESVIPPTRRRVLHEMKMALVEFGTVGPTMGAGPTWTGYGVPNPMMVTLKQGGPQVGGPGFGPQVEPGQGGRYDFQKSPGLGFRTEAAWKIWKEALDVMLRNPILQTSSIIQAAMTRAGIRYGQVDPTEMRLIEMGIEWYLSDPGRTPQPTDSSGGVPGGIGATQLSPAGT